MAADDVPLICFCDGNLCEENKNATYIGGYKRFGVIPKSISFTAFKQKIQELIKQPQSGIDFIIRIGVHFDDTEIAVDVDDDISLRSVIDHSRFIKAYVIKQLPTATTLIETQREEEELLFYDDSLLSQRMVPLMSTSNDNHNGGVRGDYNLEKELENIHPSLCLSPLHGTNRLSQSEGNVPQDVVISPAVDYDAARKGKELGEFLLDVDVHSEDSDWSLASTCHGSGVSDLGDSVRSLASTCHDSGVSDLGDSVRSLASNNDFDNYLKEAELENPSHEGCLCLDGLEGIGDFYIGQEFEDFDLFKLTLSDMAIQTKTQYKLVKSRRRYKQKGKGNTAFDVRCRDERCNWLVQALELPQGSFKVTRCEDKHKCLVDRDWGSKDHPQATIKWIVSKMQLDILKNPAMEPKKIVEAMNRRFGIKISYNKAVKAKTKVLEEMHTKSVGCYSILPKLAEELEQDGSVAKLGLASDGSTFLYFFWAFSACIHALHAHLRPKLFIETKRIAAGVLIYAHGVDGNGIDGQSVHVAFAVFEIENDMAAEIFMGFLKDFILPPAPDKDTLSSSSSSKAPFTIVTHLKERAIRTAVKNVFPWMHQSISRMGDSNDDPLEIDELLMLLEGDVVLRTQHCDVKTDEDEIINRSFDMLTIVDVVEHTRSMVVRYFSKRKRVGSKLVTPLTPRMTCYVNRCKESLPLRKVRSIIGGDKYWLWYDSPIRLQVSMVERRCTTCGSFDVPCTHAVMVIEHEHLNIMKYLAPWFTTDCYRGTYAGKLPSPMPCILQRQPASSEGRVLPSPMEKKSVGRPRKVKIPQMSVVALHKKKKTNG